MKYRALTLMTAVLGVAACSQPDPIEVTGYLDESAIEITATEQVNDTNEVVLDIIGRPGAASNTGTVTASNPRTDQVVTTDVSNTGSFVIDVLVLRNDVVTLRHSDSDDVVDVVADTLPDFPAVQDVFVSEPDHEGVVGVEVQFTAPLTVDAAVVVSNHNNHHVETLHPYEPDPQFHVGHIQAQSGDYLLLHLATADGEHSLGVETQVP